MIIMGEDAQRVKDRDAQEYNISAARAVAEAVRSTLGPKGMDKMLVDSMGDVTITNDGVTILTEMDIDNPTASMIVEVAETQEDEAGDGTTSAVAIAGELLKNAEDLLEQDIHPTAIIKGSTWPPRRPRTNSTTSLEVDPDDEELLKKVAETSMTGKGAELNKELLAQIIVDAVNAVTVEADDGTSLSTSRTSTSRPRPAARPATPSSSKARSSTRTRSTKTWQPRQRTPTSSSSTRPSNSTRPKSTRSSLSTTRPAPELPRQGRRAAKEMVDQIADTGADVVFCQKGIDDMAQHYLAKEGILAVRRAKKSDIEFLKKVLGARIVSDLDSASADDLGHGSVTRDDAEGLFYVEGSGDGAHGVTLLLRGSTDHVVDELERGVTDALDVVASTVADGSVLGGGGAPKSKSPAGSATTPTASKAANSSLSSPSPTRWRSSRAPSPRTLVSTASTRSSTCAPPTRTAMSAPA